MGGTRFPKKDYAYGCVRGAVLNCHLHEYTIRRKAIPTTTIGHYCVMNVEYVLVLLVISVVVALSDQAEDADVQYRKDLKQINYYNWLLHRHRTEKQKIEKANNDIKNARLVKLQQILDTPAPNNVTLIASDSDFAKIRRFVHPVGNKPVTESIEELTSILTPQRRQARQHDASGKPEGLVEFQLSEREYQKFSKFLNQKTMRKKVKI